MSTYYAAVAQMSKMLRNLDAWLDEAEVFAATRKMSADELLSFRLSPDMRPLSFQIESCCEAATLAARWLAGADVPDLEPTTVTLAGHRERIASVAEFLEGLSPVQFEGAGRRPVALAFLPGRIIDGEDYLMELSIPNFYFHATTAYALLRMRGVELGKRDYVGSLTVYVPRDEGPGSSERRVDEAGDDEPAKLSR
ncbi:hypothetical protein ENSA5_50240 [Enhygromyxa salina]|uniref:DUF1993 domain-containing protein n=1 Tax=Enhygromyxa salina TaxID=215803 RepID=A0A2S9XHX8_9BACT|nr:DUF1993 domain-containing protein [Enhygromyxa salina]PRP92261.1 hypothetical protein ENSA5_50240 [Enhygromyxa salina]